VRGELGKFALAPESWGALGRRRLSVSRTIDPYFVGMQEEGFHYSQWVSFLNYW
jgi:hypothetical protein